MEALLRLRSIAFSIACLACMAGGYGRARESYKITLLSKLITRVVKKAYRSLVAKVSRIPGLGSILDKVSKDTEDTAHSCILSVSKIHFQPTFINGICI